MGLTRRASNNGSWLTGGSVEVRAPVRDRLRIAAGEAVVDGVVGGKLVAAGGTVTVGSDAVIRGGARIYGGRVLVEGRIDGARCSGAWARP